PLDTITASRRFERSRAGIALGGPRGSSGTPRLDALRPGVTPRAQYYVDNAEVLAERRILSRVGPRLVRDHQVHRGQHGDELTDRALRGVGAAKRSGRGCTVPNPPYIAVAERTHSVVVGVHLRHPGGRLRCERHPTR